MIRTAVLVDGGFYRKRAIAIWGQKTPEDRAFELVKYCALHLKENYEQEKHYLYRIFYYDCPPITKQVYHPLLKKSVDLGKSAIYQWANIASLAYKKLVDQIVLIAGDSDFVPVAKLARREGIDFILDPLWSTISPSLFEHIDGLRSFKYISSPAASRHP
jgi:uncharacterized LabA/DUF88 family protein